MREIFTIALFLISQLGFSQVKPELIPENIAKEVKLKMLEDSMNVLLLAYEKSLWHESPNQKILTDEEKATLVAEITQLENEITAFSIWAREELDKIQPTFNLQSTHVKEGDLYHPLLNTILFDYNKWTFRPQCLPHLDSLAQFFIQHDSLIVQVETHVDERIDPRYSKRLDQRRSQAVVDYLIKKGVEPNHLRAKGFGHTDPIIPKDRVAQLKTQAEKEAAHAMNRRTVFKIIGIEVPQK